MAVSGQDMLEIASNLNRILPEGVPVIPEDRIAYSLLSVEQPMKLKIWIYRRSRESS